MRYATNCASPLNAPSPGRTNSSACCCALRPHRFVIWDSNSLRSRSSISGSFAEAKTCNQFDEKFSLFNAKLDAELKVFEASLKAAYVVFEQTKIRTDEVIT